MKNQDYAQTVRQIVAEVLEVDPSLIQGDTNLMLDLNADSLRMIEILSRLEKIHNVVIEQSQLARMISLDTILDVVDEAMTSA